MTRSDRLQWAGIVASAIALLAIVLSLGYGLIGFVILLLALAMAGGAFLYWIDGEAER